MDQSFYLRILVQKFFVYLVDCKLILKYLIMELKAKTFWEMGKGSISGHYRKEYWRINWDSVDMTIDKPGERDNKLADSFRMPNANNPGV